jgi:beta-lactam-binding protein with PASTA domain
VIKRVGIVLGVLLLTFGIGYLVAARILFPPLPTPKDGIIVPNLSGVAVEEAPRHLRPLGLDVAEVTELAHPTQAAGLIIAQSPLPGQQLRSGGKVRLAVSGGSPRVQIPDVVGFEVARATALLAQLGLSAEQRTEQNERAAGTVIRIVPEPGQSQPVPGRVLLVVSTGPPPPPPKPPADTTIRVDTLDFRIHN